jgi:uncharacterized protein with HEPN domain
MREPIRDKARLEHILDHIDKAVEITGRVTFEDFKKDSIIRYALAKLIEIVGEASYKLTNQLREEHPEIEWRDIISMRHILVHGYYQTEDEFIWDTAVNDLPVLRPKIQNIYDKFL